MRGFTITWHKCAVPGADNGQSTDNAILQHGSYTNALCTPIRPATLIVSIIVCDVLVATQALNMPVAP